MIRPISNTPILTTSYYKSTRTQKSTDNQTTIAIPAGLNRNNISFKSSYPNNSATPLNQDEINFYAKSETQAQQRKLEYIDALMKIKNEQIKPRLLDLIVRESKGKLTEMPNCVMLACGSKEANNDLVEWTKNNADCRVVTMDTTDDLLKTLENAEECYQKEREWTLLHINNFSNYINPKISTFETIEAAKAIMSSVAEDYHATILFTAEHPEELDDIAIESHRVRHITGDVKSMEELGKEDAWNRLLETPCIYDLSFKPATRDEECFLYYRSLSDTSSFYTQNKNHIYQYAIRDLILALGFNGKEIKIEHPPVFSSEPPYFTVHYLSAANCTTENLIDIERIIDNMLSTQFEENNYSYRLKPNTNKRRDYIKNEECRFIRNPYYNLPEMNFTPNEEYIGIRIVHPIYCPDLVQKDMIDFFGPIVTASKDEIDFENPDKTIYNKVNDSNKFKGNMQLAILGGFFIHCINDLTTNPKWIKLLDSITLDPRIDVDAVHNYLLHKFNFSANSFGRLRLNVSKNSNGIISELFYKDKADNKKIMGAVIQQLKDSELIAKTITAMKNIGYIKPLDYQRIPIVR